MTKTEQLLDRADKCVELAEVAKTSASQKRLKRLAEGWKTVAETQAWLDGENAQPGPEAA